MRAKGTLFLLGLLAACANVAGLGDFEDVPGGEAGGTTATGGQGGDGGEGGMSSTGGSTSTGGGGGDGGGGGGTNCRPEDIDNRDGTCTYVREAGNTGNFVQDGATCPTSGTVAVLSGATADAFKLDGAGQAEVHLWFNLTSIPAIVLDNAVSAELRVHVVNVPQAAADLTAFGGTQPLHGGSSSPMASHFGVGALAIDVRSPSDVDSEGWLVFTIVSAQVGTQVVASRVQFRLEVSGGCPYPGMANTWTLTSDDALSNKPEMHVTYMPP